MEDIPASVLNRAWKNRTRTCPNCSSSFSSISDRGQCTNCGLVFLASNGRSLPPGMTLDDCLPNAPWPNDATKCLALAILSEENPVSMQREFGQSRWIMLARVTRESAVDDKVGQLAGILEAAYRDAIAPEPSEEFDIEVDETLPVVEPEEVDWGLLSRCLLEQV